MMKETAFKDQAMGEGGSQNTANVDIYTFKFQSFVSFKPQAHLKSRVSVCVLLRVVGIIGSCCFHVFIEEIRNLS